MARGQSKTPAEKAREAVEEQEKVVSRLGTQIEKLEKSLNEAQTELDAAKPTYQFEKDMLDVLRRHPALGEATLPVDTSDTEPQNVPAAPEPVIVAQSEDVDFQYGVDNVTKVDARKDVDPQVRARGMQAATLTDDEEQQPPLDPPTSGRSLGSSAGKPPWSI